MEVLYFVDRVITEVLQFFSRRIEKWLRIGPRLLSLIIFLIIAADLPFLLNIPDGGLPVLLITLVLYFSHHYFEFIVADMLVTVHLFFDHQWIQREHRYEPNHLGWASVLIGVSYTLLGYRLDMEHFSLAFVIIGSLAFSHGLWHFFVRGRIDRKQKKESMIAALKKLLDRCRHWLPLPVPTPG